MSNLNMYSYTGASWERELLERELNSLAGKLNRRMRQAERHSLEELKTYKRIKRVLMEQSDLLKTGKAPNKDLATDNISFKSSWTKIIKGDYREAFRARDIMENLVVSAGNELDEPKLMEVASKLIKRQNALYPPKENETQEEAKKRKRLASQGINDIVELKNVYPEVFEMYGSDGIVEMITQLNELQYGSDNRVTIENLMTDYYNNTNINDRSPQGFVRHYNNFLSDNNMYGYDIEEDGLTLNPKLKDNSVLWEPYPEPKVSTISMYTLEEEDDDLNLEF